VAKSKESIIFSWISLRFIQATGYFNLAHLVAAQEQVTLNAIQEVDIYSGLLGTGQFQLFFGYRLKDNKLFFNGKQPISVISYP
jgi:hypothetical protein